MTWARKELLARVRQLRGGIAWYAETYPDEGIPIPEGFRIPPLGAFEFHEGGTAEAADAGTKAHPGPDPTRQAEASTGDLRLSAFLDAARQQASSPALKAMGTSKPVMSKSEATGRDEGHAATAPHRAGRFTLSMPELGKDMTDFDLKAVALQRLREEANQCQACPLHESRTEVVHGHGLSRARLMFVADGPGAAEDAVGVPFVGEAGLLLGRMIRAMGLARNQVYLTHLVRCRTAGHPCEVGLETCSDFLQTEIDIVRPEAIIALGELAARRFSQSAEAFPHLRGRWFDYEGIPVMPTFHPLALLQHPQSKARVWSDLKLVMKKLNLARPA